MRLKIRHPTSDKPRQPRPIPKRLPVTDGPFAETKELVGGTKDPDEPEE
jgi:hypothetical protein